MTRLPWEIPLEKDTALNHKATNKDLYEHLGENWRDKKAELSSLHAMHPVTLNYFMRAIGDNIQGIRLLDAGCGGGLLSETFARAGALVTGLDVKPGAIETARQHATRVGLSIDYQMGSLEDLKFTDESFDVIVASFVLEHVADLRTVAHNVARVLKPQGLFLYSGINRTFLTFMIITIGFQYVLKKIPPGTLKWNKFVRPMELEATLRDHGIFTVETQGVARRYPYSVMLWNKLRNRPVGDFILTSNMGMCYVGHATKGKPKSMAS